MGLPTSRRNRDTANEELSTVTEYLTKLNDMRAVETGLDDTRYPEHCAQPRTGRKLDGMQVFVGGKLKIKGNMMLAMLTLSSESADPLRTTDGPLPSRVAVRTTSVPDVSVSFQKKRLPIAIRGHDDGGEITITTRIGSRFRARA